MPLSVMEWNSARALKALEWLRSRILAHLWCSDFTFGTCIVFRRQCAKRNKASCGQCISLNPWLPDFLIESHITLKYLCGTSESHFIDVHVAGDSCSCCRTKTWNNVHNSGREPGLQYKQKRSDTVKSFESGVRCITSLILFDVTFFIISSFST